MAGAPLVAAFILRKPTDRRASWARFLRMREDEFQPNLRARTSDIYNPKSNVAHWCSWLTRCPLKAEITGSSPVCATNSSPRPADHICNLNRLCPKSRIYESAFSGRLKIAQRFIAGIAGVRDEVREADG